MGLTLDQALDLTPKQAYFLMLDKDAIDVVSRRLMARRNEARGYDEAALREKTRKHQQQKRAEFTGTTEKETGGAEWQEMMRRRREERRKRDELNANRSRSRLGRRKADSD